MGKKVKTNHPGVRYRVHDTRKNRGKPDVQFFIRYRLAGKLKEEALGFASEGWNAEKAAQELHKLKEAHRTGIGPQTLKERRQARIEARDAEKAKKDMEAKESLTFGQLFIDHYLPQAKTEKSERSWVREESLFRLWINPAIGDIPLKDITLLHLKNIKTKMAGQKKADRTIQYAMATIRQTFNYAISHSLYTGPNLFSIIPPKERKALFAISDNVRLRFLTPKEAGLLLGTLKTRSQETYEIALVSLLSGARADEIFSLTWGDVDFDREMLTLWDTKNTETRVGYLHPDIKTILQAKKPGNKTDYVFPGRGGVKRKQMSKTFPRVVEELGFNDGVTDRRMRVVFHTLRHTFASWLVEKGQDLYRVKELMGQKSLEMTQRYAHLSNGALREAIRGLDKPAETIKPKKK